MVLRPLLLCGPVRSGGSACEHVSAVLQGTDQDARRRRAALGAEGDGEAPDFDLASLFPGAAMGGDGHDGGDQDASGDDEEHVARAYAAQRLLDGSQVIHHPCLCKRQ